MLQNKDLQIAEFMTQRPVTVPIGTSIQKASEKLSYYRIGSLVVVDEDKKLLGIFTTRDIVYDIIALDKNPVKTLVDDIMVTNIITISPEKTIQEAMELMSTNDIRQLPVVTGEKLIGFVTMKDILRVEPALVDLAVDSFRAEEEYRRRCIQDLAQHPEKRIDELLKK